MPALLSFGFLTKLGLSCVAVGFSKKTDWRHLAIDFAFAVVSLTTYESLLGLAYFRDQTLLFIHSHWHIDLAAYRFAAEPWLGLPPGALAQALGLVFFMAVASHTNYWMHRALHVNPLLWRLHKLHHSQTSFTGLSNYRNHPLEVLFSGYVGALIIAVLCPFTSEYARFYGYFIFCMGVFTHSGLRTNLGPLEWVLVSPVAHQAHHSLDPRHVDRNYGFAFSVWDRLYGTYVHVDATEEIALGIPEYAGLRPLAVLGRSLGEPFTPARGPTPSNTAPGATFGTSSVRGSAKFSDSASVSGSANASSSGNAGPAR
jgi:sterol desaturase/sphingolipid hydroxylase (fatty acid hydroxylase superfamily)